jgi:hypothetical protein
MNTANVAQLAIADDGAQWRAAWHQDARIVSQARVPRRHPCVETKQNPAPSDVDRTTPFHRRPIAAAWHRTELDMGRD